MKQLSIQEHVINDKKGTVNDVEYPDRPGEPVCLYFLRNGTCSYGSKCRFNHPTDLGQWIGDAGELPSRDGQPECKFFLKTGTCKFGSACRYHHPPNRYFMLNTLGLPIRQGEMQCDYYMRNGTCKFGVMCKFDHPQPLSAGNSFSLTAHAPNGSNALTLLPSSGIPFAGGVVDFSISNTTQMSDPSLQVPQNYVPVVPPQVWNRYMGTMGQFPVTTVLANPTPNNQVHVLPSVSSLPDRPDQPECRDFVNTGNCYFGLKCKYHHPRDKTRILPNSLGPLGLPSRPGQPICAYYTQYGLCRYGPTCQFDHPWPGYIYSYNFGVPSPLPDTSASQ